MEENRVEMKTNRMIGKHGNKFNKNRKQKLNKKEFKCNICEETFEFKAKMVIHRKVHNGEKPYSCDVCTKSFSLKDVLKAHQRIHTGIKPFSCELCNKSFF